MGAHFEVPVVSKSAIAPGVTEITFDIPKTDFHFKAGQYATITLPATTDQPTTSQFHDFSIASSPNDHGKLKVAFRNSESFFKTKLLSMPLGSPIILEGPSGNFTLPDTTDKPIVFIAGGIGITPFMSMLSAINEAKLPHQVTLFYSNRDTGSTVYSAELQQFAKLNQSLKLVFTMTNDLQWKGETKAIGGDVIAPILGPEKIPERYISVRFLITERKEKEETLSGLLSALDQTALVSMTDAKGSIIYANQKFVEISKYALYELMGQNHRLLKSGAQPQSLFIGLWDTISHGKVWRGEIKNKAKDGTFYWVDTSIAPIMGAGGHPERYISVRFLITDKKEREQLLQKAKAMDEAILSSISHGLIGADHNGRIILVNPEAERVLGWEANETLGKPIEEALTITDAQGNSIAAENRPFRQVLSTQKAVTMPSDYYFVRKNGEKFPVTVSATPIVLDNKIIGVIEIFREKIPEK